MRAGKIIALVAGILILLISIALLIPGSVLLGLYGTQRDDAGFFETSSQTLSSSGHAVVTPDVDVNIGPLAGVWLPTGDRAAIRIRVDSAAGSPAFVGIGPSDQVADYLTDVEYDEVTDFGWAWTDVEYRHFDGGAPSSPPGSQDFWVAQEEGSDTLTLEWDIQDGSWTAVVMNADASDSVRAGVSLGARFDILLPIGIGMVVGGVILLVIAILLIVLGARSPRPPAVLQTQAPAVSLGPTSPGGQS